MAEYWTFEFASPLRYIEVQEPYILAGTKQFIPFQIGDYLAEVAVIIKADTNPSINPEILIKGVKLFETTEVETIPVIYGNNQITMPGQVRTSLEAKVIDIDYDVNDGIAQYQYYANRLDINQAITQILWNFSDEFMQ